MADRSYMGSWDVDVLAQALSRVYGDKPEYAGSMMGIPITAEMAPLGGGTPGAGANINPPNVEPSFLERLTALLGNKNVQSLLSNMGERFSMGQPAGQAIGAPAQQFIQATAAQEALAKKEALQREQFDILKRLLTGEHTPREETGMTTSSRTGNELTLKYTMPKQEKLTMAPELEEEIAPRSRLRSQYGLNSFDLGVRSLLPFFFALGALLLQTFRA